MFIYNFSSVGREKLERSMHNIRQTLQNTYVHICDIDACCFVNTKSDLHSQYCIVITVSCLALSKYFYFVRLIAERYEHYMVKKEDKDLLFKRIRAAVVSF